MNCRAVITICLAAGLLAACPARANVRVFACEPEWAALAEVIGGDRVDATSATNALQDPHYVQARPGLIAGIRKADLLICAGSGLEDAWLPLLLRKGNNARIQPGQPGYLMASQYVTRLEIPAVLDRAQGDLHAQGNPHIQTDPRNIALVARVVAERLQLIDPGNASHYQSGLADFERKWNEAISRWQRQAAPLRGKKVVLHHRSWVYLDHWLGLEEVGTLESKPGVPPSAAYLSQLLARLETSSADVIIRTPYQDSQASEWLTQHTGIPNAVLPFTVGGSPEASDLYSLFEVTINILLEKTGGTHE